MQVTSLEQLKKIKCTEIINLGTFEDGTPLIAEMKRPNMMSLLASRKIPNELLTTAMSMFNEGSGKIIKKANENDIDALVELVSMIEILAEECLVNPTYKDIKKLGIELTEEMQMSILMFTQGGIKALEGFREEQEHNESDKPIENL